MRGIRTALLTAFAALACAAIAHADVQFRAKAMADAKVSRGKAQCEIRLLVNKEVEVSLQGDRISVHTLTGADARDDGSECSEPLPESDADGFTMTVKKHRGPVKLVAAPSARNHYIALFAIHHNTPGEGAFDLRISWNAPLNPAGLNANNAFHFAARGLGKASLNQDPPVPLRNVTVDVDRGGKAMVTFPVGRSGSAIFTGWVMSWDGGVLKMDAVSGARFHALPGPMYIYFDASKAIYKIAMEGGNGQEQLKVSWERK